MAEEEKPVKAVLSWTLNGRQELLLHEGDTAEVGREDGNDLILPVEHISRKHAVITWRGGHFEVQDLGSVNGTSVNGKRITKPRVLKNGDKISFHTIEATFTEHTKPLVEEKKEGVHQTIVIQRGSEPALVISSGPGEGRRIILRRGKMTIGRATAHSENWDIALQDRGVSRPHARVEGSDGIFTLSDLGSANGTIVNGQTIDAAVTLKDGDVILIGETTLIYRAM